MPEFVPVVAEGGAVSEVTVVEIVVGRLLDPAELDLDRARDDGDDGLVFVCHPRA